MAKESKQLIGALLMPIGGSSLPVGRLVKLTDDLDNAQVFGRVCVKVSVFSQRFSFRHVHLRREKASQPKKKHHD